MKKLLSIYFLFSIIIGISVYFAQKNEFYLPKIIQNYLNDFLIIPIVLTISLYVLRWSRNDKNYTIPILLILYTCIFYTILFEIFLPKINERYTGDFIDVLLYLISSFVFNYLQKK